MTGHHQSRWTRHPRRWVVAVLIALSPVMIPMPGQVSPASADAPHCSASVDRYLDVPYSDGQPAYILGQVTLINDGDVPINVWRVHLDSPSSVRVTNVWNATAYRGPPLFLGWLFTSVSYNSSLGVGQSASFGFTAIDVAYPQGSATPSPYCTASG